MNSNNLFFLYKKTIFHIFLKHMRLATIAALPARLFFAEIMIVSVTHCFNIFQIYRLVFSPIIHFFIWNYMMQIPVDLIICGWPCKTTCLGAVVSGSSCRLVVSTVHKFLCHIPNRGSLTLPIKGPVTTKKT